MKKVIFIFFLIFSLSVSAQNCFVHQKSSQDKIEKFHTKLSRYSFYEVKQSLQKIEEKEGEIAQIYDVYTLIYWLKNDTSNALKYANLCISACFIT